MTPRPRFIRANRLRHHVLEWGDTGSAVLLLHGFLEHAHAWDFVAPLLAASGFRVYALDWRGHGDSDWVGAGGYYHFADYVADLAGIVRELGDEVSLVAHSMGGGAAILYAGTEPKRVRALVSVEGLGMPDLDPSSTPDRYADWIADLSRSASRTRPLFALDAAAEKLAQRFPHWPAGIARHMAEFGSAPAGGNLRKWKFDPLHQTRAPLPTPASHSHAFMRRVACPVLYVEGSESKLRLDDAEVAKRLTLLRADRVVIDGAGHHPHLEKPEALATVLANFLRGARCAE